MFLQLIKDHLHSILCYCFLKLLVTNGQLLAMCTSTLRAWAWSRVQWNFSITKEQLLFPFSALTLTFGQQDPMKKVPRGDANTARWL